MNQQASFYCLSKSIIFTKRSEKIWKLRNVLIFSLFLLMLQAFFNPILLCSDDTLDPKIDPKIKQDHTRWRFKHGCYIMDTETLVPCLVDNKMEIIPDLCVGQEGAQCGHNTFLHPLPPRSAKGGLQEEWDENCPLENLYDNLLYTDPLPPNPITHPYRYSYCSGNSMLQIKVTTIAYPLEGRRFLPPCESESSCTHVQYISIGFKGFVELPKSSVMSPEGKPLEYVRCGNVGCCGAECNIENAYCNDSHPTVHWGNSQLINDLKCLGREWYNRCSIMTDPQYLFIQNLGIADISLPGGGLLDINNNWKEPHHDHRRGMGADLNRRSVPIYSPYLCGTRRPVDTYDLAWLDDANPLWNLIDHLGHDCNLDFPVWCDKSVPDPKDPNNPKKNICISWKADPGHVIPWTW